MCRVQLLLLVATHFVLLSPTTFAKPDVVPAIHCDDSSHVPADDGGSAGSPPTAKTDPPFAIVESPRQDEGTLRAPSQAARSDSSTSARPPGGLKAQPKPVRVSPAPVIRVPPAG